MSNERITTTQMAAKLGCSERTVLRMAAKGVIPSIKLIRERRYDPAAVLKVVSNGPPPAKS